MRYFAFLAILLMSVNVHAKQTKDPGMQDSRAVITVTLAEREFILERMRRMLETLTSVQQSLLLDSPENADNLVRNLTAFTTENYPEGWYERMPEGFQRMEDTLNERWRNLGENNSSDVKVILKNTVQVMATCNACHRSYKIGLE